MNLEKRMLNVVGILMGVGLGVTFLGAMAVAYGLAQVIAYWLAP